MTSNDFLNISPRVKHNLSAFDIIVIKPFLFVIKRFTIFAKVELVLKKQRQMRSGTRRLRRERLQRPAEID
jgi:hypothetical protein